MYSCLLSSWPRGFRKSRALQASCSWMNRTQFPRCCPPPASASCRPGAVVILLVALHLLFSPHAMDPPSIVICCCHAIDFCPSITASPLSPTPPLPPPSLIRSLAALLTHDSAKLHHSHCAAAAAAAWWRSLKEPRGGAF